jgi:hypothetical protein
MPMYFCYDTCICKKGQEGLAWGLADSRKTYALDTNVERKSDILLKITVYIRPILFYMMLM